MNDLISRQDAIDTEGLDEQIRCEMCRNPTHTDRGCDGNCKYDEKLYERIMQILDERIKSLPSAQPEQRWIPCSEMLPEAPGFVNCTCHSLIDNREDWVVETFYMPHPSGSPYSDWGNIPMLNDGKCEVVAWMYRNIPDPYKAESEDKE